MCPYTLSLLFFFNDTSTTEIYTLSLHDALPIYAVRLCQTLALLKCTGMGVAAAMTASLSAASSMSWEMRRPGADAGRSEEHTSDSSHSQISYAVFCLKKKKKKTLSLRSSLRNRM